MSLLLWEAVDGAGIVSRGRRALYVIPSLALSGEECERRAGFNGKRSAREPESRF